MNFLTFLVANGARLALQATKEANAAGTAHSATVAKQKSERLKEAWEPQVVQFVETVGNPSVEQLYATLSPWIWGGTPPCSYCGTLLNFALTEPPKLYWTRLYKKPPPGARDMRIVVKEGWSAHGAWRLDFLPCSKCGLQHTGRVGEFSEITP